MKNPNRAAMKWAKAYLALGAVSIVATSAGAQGSSVSSASIAPALKCEDLTGWNIPGSTTVVTKAQVVPEAPPGTV